MQWERAKTNKLGVSTTVRTRVCVRVCVCDLLSLIAAETVMNTCRRRRGSVAVSVAVHFDVCVAACVAVTFLSTTRRLLIQKNESITTIETHTHTHTYMRTRTRTHGHTQLNSH